MHILQSTSRSMPISMNGVWRLWSQYHWLKAFTAERGDFAGEILNILKNAHIWSINKLSVELQQQYRGGTTGVSIIPLYLGIKMLAILLTCHSQQAT